MKHVTMIEQTPHGHIGRCETCQERMLEYAGYGTAQAWCDDHEHYPNKARGSRPSLTTLERFYRELSTNPVYDATEQAQWLMLADEIADRLKPKQDVIDGQMDLFDLPQREETS